MCSESLCNDGEQVNTPKDSDKKFKCPGSTNNPLKHIIKVIVLCLWSKLKETSYILI